MPRSDEASSTPTCEIDQRELLGLRTRSTGDDFLTRRMQAEDFQVLLRDGEPMMPITPTLLESVDWYREADAAARRTMTARLAPEEALEELDRQRSAGGVAEPESGGPASSAPAPELARSPEERPSTPRPERRAVIEMPPIGRPARRDGATHLVRRTVRLSLPPPRSDGLRILISLIILAIAGAILGLAIVDAIAWLVT